MAEQARIAAADRRPTLSGRSVEVDGVSIRVTPPSARLSLRAPEASLDALSEALGLDLPRRPKQSATSGGRSALWLGPDEWLVVDADGAELAASCARAGVLHSAVDISHRNIALLVEGRNCEAVLAAGCPQDLAPGAFPVGACSRTVLGKIEVIVWRTGAEAFRVECWRSFSDYALALLDAAARDAGA